MSEPLDATMKLFATFAIIAACVVPFFSYLFKCKWWKLTLFALLLGLLMFSPTCSLIWEKIDEGRFGLFHYHQHGDVDDERVLRYLPPRATRITLFKTAHGGGYIAHYKIEEGELMAYVDTLWDDYGEFSAVPKDEFESSDENLNAEPLFEMLSTKLHIDPPTVKLRCGSPVGGNGAGARYYYIQETEEVFQFSGYW